jgi:hypothetical protein
LLINDKAELKNVASIKKQSFVYCIELIKMKKICCHSLLLFFYFSVSAQVAVRYEPRHKVALENEYIRLLDVRVLPGDTSLFHIHEITSFFIPLSVTAIGSEVKGQPRQESKLIAGATWYNGFENGPLIHRVWNSDTNVLHVIDLELLSAKNKILPTTQLAGAGIDFENEKLRVYKLPVATGQTIPLPLLNTPMLLISVSGPILEINDPAKKGPACQVGAGGFQWLNPRQNFVIKNKETGTANVILILLK